MKRQEWFEIWFDTPYYHFLYEDRDEEEAEQFLNALLNYLQLPAGSSVLDVACGTGRYSHFLESKNFNVVGIDLSWKNIQQASTSESDHLMFLLHDMRKPFYVNYFDATFNFFTSFGYFSSEKDNLKAIHSLSTALRKGGRSVIDFFNTEKVIRKLMPDQQLLRNNILFTIKKRLENDVIIKNITFSDQGKEFEFEERVQALRLRDFEQYFQNQHLKLKDVFGDYHLQAFDPQHSERMILVAEK